MTDPAMRRILKMLWRVARTTLPVLLHGESGSGKEVLADWLHRVSGRAHMPMVKVNCAGLTESLVESELFGHERGAFTGAVQAHAGLFEAADGGTLFLDEIAELPLRTQAKLLRALETHQIVRVGGTRARQISCRVVSATHRDLAQMVERGEFRGDLYFRLCGVTVEVPPLRARPREIVALAEFFIKRCTAAWCRPALALSPEAAAMLISYSWPGNVRELRHAIELGVALSEGSSLSAEALSYALGNTRREGLTQVAVAAELTAAREAQVAEPTAPDDVGSIRSEIQKLEQSQISAALTATGGNQTQAAKLLGISRRTLTNKLTQYRFERPRQAARALSSVAQLSAALLEAGGNRSQAAKLLGVSRRTLSARLVQHGVDRPREVDPRADE